MRSGRILEPGRILFVFVRAHQHARQVRGDMGFQRQLARSQPEGARPSPTASHGYTFLPNAAHVKYSDRLLDS